MRLALFDIDGTLVTGPSTEKRFALELARRGRIGPRQALAFLAFIPPGLAAHGRHVLKKDKAWVSGLREEDVAAIAADWASRALAHAWFEPCVARLARHRQAGDVVALLSGTPQFVATAIGTVLGVDVAIGARCSTERGRFLARAPLVHPFGAGKIATARELALAHGTDLAEATAYADSIHDLPLFLAVGRPVAVRPDERLAAEAAARGWETLGEVRRGFVRGLLRSAAPLPGATDRGSP
jgi:HAD superfamily hydrolase (TIGR01490 family)